MSPGVTREAEGLEMRTHLPVIVALTASCLGQAASAQARLEPFVSVGMVSVGVAEVQRTTPYSVPTSFRRGATIGAGLTIRVDPWVDVRFEGILNPAVGTTPSYSSCLFAACVNVPHPLPPAPRSSTTFGRVAVGLGLAPDVAARRFRLGFGATWAKTGGVTVGQSAELGGYASIEVSTIRWHTRSLTIGMRYTELLSPIADAQRFLEPTVTFHF
jgi:hypothetical protein